MLGEEGADLPECRQAFRGGHHLEIPVEERVQFGQAGFDLWPKKLLKSSASQLRGSDTAESRGTHRKYSHFTALQEIPNDSFEHLVSVGLQTAAGLESGEDRAEEAEDSRQELGGLLRRLGGAESG